MAYLDYSRAMRRLATLGAEGVGNPLLEGHMPQLPLSYANGVTAVLLRIMAWDLYIAKRELKVQDVVTEQVQIARTKLGLKPLASSYPWAGPAASSARVAHVLTGYRYRVSIWSMGSQQQHGAGSTSLGAGLQKNAIVGGWPRNSLPSSS